MRPLSFQSRLATGWWRCLLFDRTVRDASLRVGAATVGVPGATVSPGAAAVAGTVTASDAVAPGATVSGVAVVTAAAAWSRSRRPAAPVAGTVRPPSVVAGPAAGTVSVPGAVASLSASLRARSAPAPVAGSVGERVAPGATVSAGVVPGATVVAPAAVVSTADPGAGAVSAVAGVSAGATYIPSILSIFSPNHRQLLSAVFPLFPKAALFGQTTFDQVDEFVVEVCHGRGSGHHAGGASRARTTGSPRRWPRVCLLASHPCGAVWRNRE